MNLGRTPPTGKPQISAYLLCAERSAMSKKISIIKTITAGAVATVAIYTGGLPVAIAIIVLGFILRLIELAEET